MYAQAFCFEFGSLWVDTQKWYFEYCLTLCGFFVFAFFFVITLYIIIIIIINIARFGTLTVFLFCFVLFCFVYFCVCCGVQQIFSDYTCDIDFLETFFEAFGWMLLCSFLA